GNSPLSHEDVFTSIEFDSSTGTLYGVAFLTDSHKLVTIDPDTGEVTPVDTSPGVTGGVSFNFSALDPINHHYFIFNEDPPGTGIQLVAFDTRTGAVVGNSPLSHEDVFTSIEFDSHQHVYLPLILHNP
ncbi:MAG: hypothetical protein ACE5LU_10280, partial [Anaerolineae bacterium]